MNILMFSYWDFQRHGMQVTKKTPLYFAEKGHRVDFIVQSEMTAKPDKVSDLHENLTVWRCNVPFAKLVSVPKLGRLWVFLCYCVYSLYVVFAKILPVRKPDIVYAAESDAILIGKVINYFVRVPFVSRYYGLSDILIDRGMLSPMYYISLRVGSDLAIVTDDGTDGEEKLRSLNNGIGSVLFLRNGVDVEKIGEKEVVELRHKYSIGAEDTVFITVSRLYGWKRVDRAIKAFSFALKGGCKHIRLIVVGHGPEEDALLELVEKENIGEYVTIVGAVDHESVSGLYSMSHVLISLYEMSNVGNPLFEAQKMGLPVITIDNGDTSAVISDGVNGILCDDGVEGNIIRCVSKAICRVSRNSGYLEALRKGAFEFSKSHAMSWEERLDVELRAIQGLSAK